jgi:hypothetical protein
MKKRAEWVGEKKKFLYMYIFNVFIKKLCNVVGKQGGVTNWGFQFFFCNIYDLINKSCQIVTWKNNFISNLMIKICMKSC